MALDHENLVNVCFIGHLIYSLWNCNQPLDSDSRPDIFEIPKLGQFATDVYAPNRNILTWHRVRCSARLTCRVENGVTYKQTFNRDTLDAAVLDGSPAFELLISR
jgi:hypothetical protein